MFGSGTAQLFEQLPALEGMTSTEARRALSSAYIQALSLKAEAETQTAMNRRQTTEYLLRLAATLESYAIFDVDPLQELRQGAAFVAAESLALAVPLLEADAVESESYTRSLDDPRLLSRFESALLYLISGYDPNAGTLLSDIGNLRDNDPSGAAGRAVSWLIDALVRLCMLMPGAVAAEPELDNAFSPGAAASATAALSLNIGRAINLYMAWLIGEADDGLEQARTMLARCSAAVIRARETRHAHLFHLAKLVDAAIASTSRRALRTVPSPTQEDSGRYGRYLRGRAAGATLRPRPLLWPTSQDYVAACLPGPLKNAVVSVPTGSGKSFIAELGISQAAVSGWVLYLVPTNALANQVRVDLRKGLSTLEGVDVRAFLGGEEYTTLSEERVQDVPLGTVAVMTPEKCALALRLSPDSFRTCRLCVFDECHLLGEGGRGALAELVLAHILTLAPDCRFLLMSAMISNGDELRVWLQKVSGHDTVAIASRWRPTRTMRGVLGADLNKTQENANHASATLSSLPPRRVRVEFEAPHVMMANLQGSWSEVSEQHYALVSLQSASHLVVSRAGGKAPFIEAGGWVNDSAASLTTHFVQKGLSVLTFIPANRHYPFSVAEHVHSVQTDFKGTVIEHLLTVADDELGVPSEVGRLLRQGIAIHTSSLLDSEKNAAEIAFRDGHVKAMLATGTLAQGLNLPASIVIVAGTHVGDRRDAERPEIKRRTYAQMLNALGRAGRAGVANQGLGLVIPNAPVYLKNPQQASQIINHAPFLASEDDSTRVESQLTAFVQSVISGSLDVRMASAEELVAISYLPLSPDLGAATSDILRHTIAFSRYQDAAPDLPTRAATALETIGTAFINQAAAPAWTSAVTYKTGLPFFIVTTFYESLSNVLSRGFVTPPEASVFDWLDLLFESLVELPLQTIAQILPFIEIDTLTPIWQQTLPNDVQGAAARRVAFEQLKKATKAFMNGGKLAEIAVQLLGAEEPVSAKRTSGQQPIPRMLSFFKETLENLSQIAGALLAIQEELERESSDAPSPIPVTALSVASINSLPLAIKSGCGTTDSLAWFRFGVRLRRAAHLLAKLYPLPNGETSDSDQRRFISRQMEDLLSVEPTSIETLDLNERTMVAAIQGILRT